MKLCVRCQQNEQRGHGSYCAACHNEYQKAYYKRNPWSISASGKRRRAYVRALIRQAKDRPCADCGASYPYFVMDFDHVRGTKLFILGIAASKLRAIATIEAEILKCDVVCANCHRVRTFGRLP